MAPDLQTLQQQIEAAFIAGAGAHRGTLDAFLALRDALEAGMVRAAEPDPTSELGWRVNAWVKQGILLGFRLGRIEGTASPYSEQTASASEDHRILHPFPFTDKHTYPARLFRAEDGVRIVPGGSSVRAGAYLAKGTVVMPPAYVNVGAFVDEGTMIDSHALVGSCAQVGKRVHISAAAQIGGVLEPVNATPVILEDDVLVGGNCGVYEGTLVRKGAVLASGVILTRGTPVYDLVQGLVLRADGDRPLVIPANAVVVPGARAVTSEPGKSWGLSVATPVIVKYRDAKTELSLALEELLR